MGTLIIYKETLLTAKEKVQEDVFHNLLHHKSKELGNKYTQPRKLGQKEDI
jgi:hypothetical protein